MMNPLASCRALLAAALFGLLPGCSSSGKDGLPIGVLLPRTGQLADSGGHAESASIMAAERINLAGGIAGGQPLMLVEKDTRSDARFGADAARKLLESSLLGVLGPEEEDVAATLVSLGRERQLVQISGGVTSPRFTTADDGGFFFRTCPSSLRTASAIALRMREDGMGRVAFLYVPNDFGSAFISSATIAFQAAGGALVSPGVAAPVSVLPDQSDFREVLTTLLQLKPDALLLATDPVTGARLVRDWRLLGGAGKLYFAPTLMTDVFVQEAGGLEGMVGVSALSGDQTRDFRQAYAEWSGEPPAQAAYFYYDAMAVLALSIEQAWRDAGGAMPDGEQIRRAVPAVAGPPGEKVKWDELERALELIRAGQDVDYVGASGEIDFDANGDVTVSRAEFWTVEGATIVHR